MHDARTTGLQEKLASELTGAGRLLEDIAVRLCEDPLVFARHAESVQRFDEVAQIIGEIVGVLRSTGTTKQAIAAIRLEAMRIRMTDSGEPRL